jgi:hypothetical protein
MGNKNQREVQNLSDNLITSPLIFNTFSLHKENTMQHSFHLHLWPPNSPDLNPVDYKIWSVV